MRADLALVGFGNVARRFAALIEERREQLRSVFDLDPHIVGIATATHGAVASTEGVDAVEAARMTSAGKHLRQVTAAEGLDEAEGSLEIIQRLGRSEAAIRAVIETTTLGIADGRPAVTHVEHALEAGLHVITANKGPVAFAYSTLHEAARKRGLSFLFEGAVMDGVPVFNLVRETMPGVRVSGFRGVVNSTTNHILTAVESGEAFDAALARMQREGIAEADPSLDVDGWDAAAKAAALANVFLDARVTPHDVDRTGLDQDTADRARSARSRGLHLKLVASAQSGERPIVRLEELPASDLLAGLRGMQNALILRTDVLGEVAICQLTGNLTMTAHALLSDLITVRRRSTAPSEAPARRSP